MGEDRIEDGQCKLHELGVERVQVAEAKIERHIVAFAGARRKVGAFPFRTGLVQRRRGNGRFRRLLSPGGLGGPGLLLLALELGLGEGEGGVGKKLQGLAESLPVEIQKLAQERGGIGERGVFA